MNNSKKILGVTLSACMLASVVFAEDKVDVASCNSLYQARDFFDKSKDDSVKLAAYTWVKNRAEKCGASELGEVYSALSRMSKTLGKGAAFEELCVKRSSDPSPEIRNAVVCQLADWYAGVGDYEKALKLLTDDLKEGSVYSSSQIAASANRAATILSSNLMRYSEAASILSNALVSVTTNNPSPYASLANNYASILRKNLSDVPSAEAVTRQVLALGNACPGQAYATAVETLASIQNEKGDREGALGTWILVLKHSSLPSGGIAKKIIDCGATSTNLEECLSLVRSRMAVQTTDIGEFQSRLERLQPEIVDFLVVLGRREEAVRECRVFLFAASDRSYSQAVDLSARTLKALDGNLGRANALLNFQSLDGSSSKAGENVLMAFPALDDAVRTAALNRLAKAAPPLDFNGWLARSAYLLWLDRPIEAMEAGRAAFAVCPLSDTPLQTCASATVRPLLLATRDTSAAQTMIDYMLWGSFGKDSLAGTADDLSDPFPKAREKLAYSVPSTPAK